MNDHDLSTAEALRRLSVAPDRFDGEQGAFDVSRRNFLKVIGAGLGGAVAAGALPSMPGIPGWDDHMAEAAPIGDHDGIVVLIGLYGGNDGLRMVAPVGNSQYERLRPRVHISADSMLPLDSTYSLCPELTQVKQRWDAGQVAIVHGAGYANPSLSHFSSMAYWMSGRPNGVPTSGWIGRWLDRSAPDLFRAATIGYSVPLHMLGEQRRAISVPTWGINIGGLKAPEHLRAYKVFKKYADQPASAGPWTKAIGANMSNIIDVAQTVSPIFADSMPALPDSEIGRKLTIAARLINADLGFRVLDAGFGDFDHHSGETTTHPERMTELNDAIEAFYATLDPTWRRRVILMTFSEFGRTPFDNDSEGTDHGTSETMMVIGHQVKGGFYSDHPRLSIIKEDWDRLEHTIDFRSVYASVLDDWLGGGAKDVLGGTFDKPGLFKGGPRL